MLNRNAAFTLVELLVVITIIVILLALLAPAMDQAIYHAEMTQCAANMRGIATAVVVYAVDYRRWYPLREFGDTRARDGPGDLPRGDHPVRGEHAGHRDGDGRLCGGLQAVVPLAGVRRHPRE